MVCVHVYMHTRRTALEHASVHQGYNHVYIYIYTCICMYTIFTTACNMKIHTHPCTHIRTSLYTYIHVHMHTNIYAHVLHQYPAPAHAEFMHTQRQACMRFPVLHLTELHYRDQSQRQNYITVYNPKDRITLPCTIPKTELHYRDQSLAVTNPKDRITLPCTIPKTELHYRDQSQRQNYITVYNPKASSALIAL